jgi:hypothetical protein
MVKWQKIRRFWTEQFWHQAKAGKSSNHPKADYNCTGFASIAIIASGGTTSAGTTFTKTGPMLDAIVAQFVVVAAGYMQYPSQRQFIKRTLSSSIASSKLKRSD